MGVPDNMAAVGRFYATGPSDNDADRYPFASPDIVWHVPGNNHVSGRYAGVDDVFGRMPGLMQPLDQWDIEVIDLMGNDDLVVARVHLCGRRGQKTVDCPGAHVFRLDANARIVEAWGFVDDQVGLDALFDS